MKRERERKEKTQEREREKKINKYDYLHSYFTMLKIKSF